MQLSERLDRVFPLMHQASAIALRHYGRISGRNKPDGTVVTDADKEIELLLIDGLKSRFPGETIVGEETGTSCGNPEYAWSIDPIDGTAAYLSRLPHWGISLGLFHKGAPVLGVVFMPALGENYWAAKGCGAYMASERWGQEPLHVTSDTTVTENSLVMVPSHFHRKYGQFEFPGKLRSLGSTVSQVLMVARGSAIGAVSRAYQWDYAGCLPILLEAGGVVATLDGSPVDVPHMLPDNTPRPHLIMAAPQHKELMLSVKPR